MKKILLVSFLVGVPVLLMAGPKFDETSKISKEEFVSQFGKYLTRYKLVNCFHVSGYNHIDTGVIIYGICDNYYGSSYLYLYGKQLSMYIRFSNDLNNRESFSTQSEEGRREFKSILIKTLNYLIAQNNFNIDIQTLIPKEL